MDSHDKNRGLHALAANSGMITLSNETSPAFIQYGSKTSEAIRLCNNENFHNGLAYAYTLSQEQILKARREIAAISDRCKKQRAFHILEKLAAADSFSDGVCRVYSEQLRNLFAVPVPQPYNLEATDILNRVMIDNLKDENSLTHYIFANPKVCKYYHDCFAGIAMGWKAKDACDESGKSNGIAGYDAFWELKNLKNSGCPSKKMSPYYKALMFDKYSEAVKMPALQDIIRKIEKGELAPKYLSHVVFCFLESGVLTVGGLAQAPYNTVVKKRCAQFVDGLCSGIRCGKFPPLPATLTIQNLQQRKAAVSEMPTEIPVAGLGVLMSEDGVHLADYGEFLEDRLHIDEAMLQKIKKIKVRHAIQAAAASIFEYKLGAGDYCKLVGDRIISYPQTILSDTSKQAAAAELRGKIAGPQSLDLTRKPQIALPLSVKARSS